MTTQADRIRRRYRRLVFLTLFLTFDLIMFGAFVRLTDSGLGCPDWPGCYSRITPIGAMDQIRAAHEAMPYGPVSVAKAWIEMIHRYVASFLGLLIIGIMVMAWRYRAILRQGPGLATALFIAVCLQGAFGAWTVTLKLMPVIVTTHLLGGMLLLGMTAWLASRLKAHPEVPAQAVRWRPWMVLGVVILTAQIALGGWVSTNYAALACLDFPTCHGEWVPEMDFAGGYSLVRALGELPSGEMISQTALTAIHWTHRNFAFVVFAYLGWLAWRLRSYTGLRTPATGVLVVLAVQFATGLGSVVLQWPLLLAVLHNGGAALLVLLCTTLLVRLVRIGRDPATGELFDRAMAGASAAGQPSSRTGASHAKIAS